MSDLPEPLVPVEVDLRNFPDMPLEVARLRDSELASCDAEVFRTAIMSWCAAWHQVPAASLPDDDTALARMLGFGRDLRTWRRVRAAGGLRGWVKCSDGRLYHPVLASKAHQAWRAKLAQRDRTAKARLASLAKAAERELDPTRKAMLQAEHDALLRTLLQGVSQDPVTGSVTGPVAASKGREGIGSEGKGRDRSSGGRGSPPPPPPAEDDHLGTDDPTVRAAGTHLPPIPRALTLADLQNLHPGLAILPCDREAAEGLLKLYGAEAWRKVLPALIAEAAQRPAGKPRVVYVSNVRAALAARFDLQPEDYARAGLAVPEGATNAR